MANGHLCVNVVRLSPQFLQMFIVVPPLNDHFVILTLQSLIGSLISQFLVFCMLLSSLDFLVGIRQLLFYTLKILLASITARLYPLSPLALALARSSRWSCHQVGHEARSPLCQTLLMIALLFQWIEAARNSFEYPMEFICWSNIREGGTHLLDGKNRVYLGLEITDL